MKPHGVEQERGENNGTQQKRARWGSNRQLEMIMKRKLPIQIQLTSKTKCNPPHDDVHQQRQQHSVRTNISQEYNMSYSSKTPGISEVLEVVLGCE